MEELPEGFECLGAFLPAEAKRFLDALEKEGLPVHAEFSNGLANAEGAALAFGGFGGTAEVMIATHEANRAAVHAIYARVFEGGQAPESATGHPEGEESAQAEGEIELLDRREELVGGIEELEENLRVVATEIVAMTQELRDGPQGEDRMSVLREARERHMERGSQLEGAKLALEKGLEELDKELYGEE